jgi:ribosomal protein S18 acetylase RimI-like enzyme
MTDTDRSGAGAPVELAPAATLDADTLARLFTAGYAGYPLPVELDGPAFSRMAEIVDADLGLSRVAVVEDEPVGIALLARRDAEGWIGGMGVVSSHRRRGIGRAVLVAALDAGRGAGIERVSLEVLDRNDTARRLYGQLGFEVVRELEVWSVPTGSGEPREVDAAVAHEWLRAHRTEREPWQRDDRSLGRLSDATGLLVDGAAALVRVAGGRVGVLQLDGRPEALRNLLTGARTLGESLSVVNLPAAHPASVALEALGGAVTVRQHEMVLQF